MIKWSTQMGGTDVPLAGFATATRAVANGPFKWGTGVLGTYIVTCHSNLPDGRPRMGREYAAVLHRDDGKVVVVVVHASANDAVRTCQSWERAGELSVGPVSAPSLQHCGPSQQPRDMTETA